MRAVRWMQGQQSPTRNPKDANQTWTGRGRWLNWIVEAGGDMKRFPYRFLFPPDVARKALLLRRLWRGRWLRNGERTFPGKTHAMVLLL